MINKKKLCALAMVLTLAVPTIANASTQTDSISFGNMVADCKLACSWSAFSYDKAKAKTDFTSSSNTGYSVTAYLEAVDSNGNRMGSAKFDSGRQWAECNLSKTSVEYYNSTHSIANSNNVYKELSVTQLSDD
ncbi:hypothetical protein DVW08_17140 [Clostridium botulinum]|uniref:hypothetical protein n=1 Tax=Clostridium sp. ZBS12 TaxID=2949972 RepID=UPI001D229B2A|nr:hypothetical protein [Clostridium sp. ZBS12]MBN1047055.1 hypothetical protein [Clostridium botulinum]